MERDIRRDRGQWRGCHTFNDITIDDDFGARDKKRNGGLKMGNTYYYYVSNGLVAEMPSTLANTSQYELDGTHEAHNPALPTTTQCPYLPGQTVNTLEVPYEMAAERKRSASLGSLHQGEYRTMNPEDKFITPRPPPPIPGSPHQRLGSAPAAPPSRAIARSGSTSPPPTWRRLFSRKPSTSRSTERGRQMDDDERPVSPYSYTHSDDSRSESSDGSRTRDLSPESLRRFLSDENPFARANENRPTVYIPDDIVEEIEDDENFASSALSEINHYATSLSPPPFKRSHSDSILPTVSNVKVLTREKKYSPLPPLPIKELEEIPPASRFSFSSDSSVASSIELLSPEDEAPSFYDSTDDDRFSNESDVNYVQPLSLPVSRKPSLEQNYSLPRAPGMKNHPGVTTTVVSAPTDNQLDDLVNEMGWMVDIIRGKGV